MFGHKADLIRQVGREKDSTALRLLLDEVRGKGWLADGSLAGVDLSNTDLSRVKLTGAVLRRANLSGANLRHADLHHAIFNEAHLTGADLSEADLREATFENALLKDANLNGAQLKAEQLSLAEMLNGATMPDGRRYDGRFGLQRDLLEARSSKVFSDQADRMSGWYGVGQEEYERGQQWADINLRGCRQAGFSFARADIDWLAAAREKGRLTDGSLNGEDLAGINLAGCDLGRANFVGALLADASFLRADLSFADLSKAALSGCDMVQVTASHTILRGADLAGANLARADLRGADFTGAVVDGALLEEADLRGARISQAQLVMVDTLRGATMPDGHPYDGRFLIDGDLDGAEETGIDLDDSGQMAAWYDVDEKVYLAGQKWAEANLEALLPEED